MQAITEILQSHKKTIEEWFETQTAQLTLPFYVSVDIRNAGFKIAPIDNNLFPGGFNNLDRQSIDFYASCAKQTLEAIHFNGNIILIVCESMTHNIYYYENLYFLSEILSAAGYQPMLGSLLQHLKSSKSISLPSNHQITLHPIENTNNQITINGVQPDLILLNNDLTSGIPEILTNIEQPMIPMPQLGWHTRLKSIHFNYYQQLCKEFANEIRIDPWLLFPEFRVCENYYFLSPENEAELIEQTSELLKLVEKKYQEYNIQQQPFVVVKSNHGTYGMAVMMVQDAHVFSTLTRRQRVQMSSSKSGVITQAFIIQEGIYSVDTVTEHKAIAEPVIYMMGKHILGGFYRYHLKRSQQDNLNVSGMAFKPIPVDKVGYAEQVIARLSALATGKEMEKLHDN